MRINTEFFVVLFIMFISSNVLTFSQEVLSKDSLIGTWTYKGPQMIAVEDTIFLSKELPKTNYYTKWSFKPYGNKLEITIRPPSVKDNLPVVETTKLGTKWFYENKSNILIVQTTGDYKQYFNIISYKNQCIELVRIK